MVKTKNVIMGCFFVQFRKATDGEMLKQACAQLDWVFSMTEGSVQKKLRYYQIQQFFLFLTHSSFSCHPELVSGSHTDEMLK